MSFKLKRIIAETKNYLLKINSGKYAPDRLQEVLHCIIDEEQRDWKQNTKI